MQTASAEKPYGAVDLTKHPRPTRQATAEVARRRDPPASLPARSFCPACPMCALPPLRSPRPLRVLIAAESLDLCTYLRQALTAAALPVGRVVEAYDGARALALLDAATDVVLCQAGLPCPAAPTLYAALRQDPRLRRAPVVLLAEAPGAEQGPDPHAVTLTAPFDAGQLAGAVRQVLQARRATPGGGPA